MVKFHLKRINTPRTWPIKRKGLTFITRPFPSGHPAHHSLPISTIFKEVIKLSTSNRETRNILLNTEVMLNQKRVRDLKNSMGLMDTLELRKTGECYRMVLSGKGKLMLIPIDKKEVDLTISKIRDKKLLKGGKVQLNLSDGKNIIVKKDSYSTGDSLLLKLPTQEVQKTVNLTKGASVYMVGGSHIGEKGILEDIQGRRVFIKAGDGSVYESMRSYAFAIDTITV